MVAMTLYLAFCGGLSAGGGFYMERKKLAWRAAGAGKWTGYEGVAGSSIGGANAVSGAVVSKMNGYEKMRRGGISAAPYIYS